MAKAVLRFCIVLVFAVGAAFFLRNDAEAQEATVIVTAAPPSLVSVRPDGTLVYRGTVAGIMTATVFAVTGTVTGGNFSPGATGRLFITLRGLNSCSIGDGCDAFGLENLSSADARRNSLIAMNPVTVSMFAASGANLDEVFAVPSSVFNDRTGFSAPLIYWVAESGKLSHVTILKNAGANIEKVSQDGFTALHLASRFGYVPALTVLLSVGANTETSDRRNFAALHIAAFNGRITALSILLDAGANLERESFSGYTPLAWTIYEGRVAAFNYLISRGAIIDGNYYFGGGSAFHIGARDESANVLPLIRDLVTVPVNLRNDNGRGVGPLHIAAANNAAIAISVLSSLGHTLDDFDGSSRTPMHYAAQNNGIKAITALATLGAKLNVTAIRYFKTTPLDLAVINKRWQARTVLLSLGAFCNIYKNRSGCLPLGVCDISRGCFDNELLMTLTTQASRINAVLSSSPSVFADLIKNVNTDEIIRDRPLISHIIIANLDSHLTILISAGADINAVGTGGGNNADYAPIQTALEYARFNMVTILIQASANIMFTNVPLGHRLINAVPFNSFAEVYALGTLLLSAGMDINALDHNGSPAIVRYSRGFRTSVISMLITLGANLNATSTSTGNNALHRAVINDRFVGNELEFIGYLVSLGVSVNAKNRRGRTPLDGLLLERFADDFVLATLSVYGMRCSHFGIHRDCPNHYLTPLALLTAITTQNLATASVILLNTGGANGTLSNGDTYLHFAAQDGRWNAGLVSLLLAAGASVSATVDTGETALHYALPRSFNSAGSYTIVDMLIRAGADVNARDNNGNTPADIMFGRAHTSPSDHERILTRLRNAGARCNNNTSSSCP